MKCFKNVTVGFRLFEFHINAQSIRQTVWPFFRLYAGLGRRVGAPVRRNGVCVTGDGMKEFTADGYGEVFLSAFRFIFCHFHYEKSAI